MISSIVTAMRPKQWVKNILIFLPAIMAHHPFAGDNPIKMLLAFCSFSLMASCVYIVNDVLDYENDKRHPTKKNRPIASGKISYNLAFVIGGLLFLSSLALSLTIFSLTKSFLFLFLLLFYFILTLSYSLYFKKIVFIDIIILSFFYTFRILVGGIVTETPISIWLLAISTFFFLGLAFLKRYIEIKEIKKDSDEKVKISGRGYSFGDENIIFINGQIASQMTLLILALYIKDPAINYLYKTPMILWPAIPLLFYWNMRIWRLAELNKIKTDPVLFTVKDKMTYIIGPLFALIFVLAKYLSLDIQLIF